MKWGCDYQDNYFNTPYKGHHDISQNHSSSKDQGNFLYRKYSSAPDLSSFHHTILDHLKYKERFSKNLIHEFTTVDELTNRRKRPPDSLRESHFDLYNYSEPSIPFSVIKSEYVRQYTEPELSSHPHLLRRSTSLKLLGDQRFRSEYHSEYVAYDHNFNRSSKIKYPENFKLSGDIEFLPEYTSAYKYINYKPMSDINLIGSEQIKPSKKYYQQYCNLKLEGEQIYKPEYKSKFIEYPRIEKSRSIPQISHIKFNGNNKNFNGIAEYRDRYRNYDYCVKNAAIKKTDNLNLYGSNETIPEYRERYRRYNRNDLERTLPIIKNDTLDLRGDFSKDLPEYYESFKDPQITLVPEKMKSRKPYLSLSGTTEYFPEYKSTYLDFPRCRPTVKKPNSSIKFIPANDSSETQLHNQQPVTSNQLNIHDPPDKEEPILNEPPELRKAQMELLKKQRNINRKREIFNQINDLPKQICIDDTISSTTPIHTTTETDRDESTSNDEFVKVIRPKFSPSFKLMVENVDDISGSFRRKSPRYGRRAINFDEPNKIINDKNNNSQNIRNCTKVIEGNYNYCNNKDQLDMSPSFVILDEPQSLIKPNKWMKSGGWYDR